MEREQSVIKHLFIPQIRDQIIQKKKKSDEITLKSFFKKYLLVVFYFHLYFTPKLIATQHYYSLSFFFFFKKINSFFIQFQKLLPLLSASSNLLYKSITYYVIYLIVSNAIICVDIIKLREYISYIMIVFDDYNYSRRNYIY